MERLQMKQSSIEL